MTQLEVGPVLGDRGERRCSPGATGGTTSRRMLAVEDPGPRSSREGQCRPDRFVRQEQGERIGQIVDTLVTSEIRQTTQLLATARTAARRSLKF